MGTKFDEEYGKKHTNPMVKIGNYYLFVKVKLTWVVEKKTDPPV